MAHAAARRFDGDAQHHQAATAKKLGAFGRVTVAMDEHELGDRLQQMSEIKPAEQIGRFASPSLLRVLAITSARATTTLDRKCRQWTSDWRLRSWTSCVEARRRLFTGEGNANHR